jgi:sensor histidine kinase YesM
MSSDRQPSRALFWKLQLCGWVGIALLSDLAEMSHHIPAYRFWVNVFAPLIEVSLTLLLRPYCRRLCLRNHSWLGYGWRVLLAILPASALFTLVVKLADSLFGPANWREFFFLQAQEIVLLFLWCILYYTIKQWQHVAQTQERLLRAELAAREARQSMLRLQLNPHFLFNSMNAVSMLILEDQAAARRMIGQIANLLRTTLEDAPAVEVSLAREIQMTREYLEIEQIRLEHRLKVELDICPETLDTLTPSMILQPLVENAIRHGVAPCIAGGVVRIASEIAHGRLRLTIANTGASFDPSPARSGIGLANTAERLAVLYGGDHSFLMEGQPTGGCVVTLEIPLRRVGDRLEQLPCAS